MMLIFCYELDIILTELFGFYGHFSIALYFLIHLSLYFLIAEISNSQC